MTQLVGTGPINWSMESDDDGHRTYSVSWRTEGNIGAGVADGPARHWNTPGLPIPGSIYQIDGDLDLWAFCKFKGRVSKDQAYAPGDPARYMIVEKEFSTRPFKRCNDFAFENPLLEPPEIEIDSNKFTREEIFDRFGNALMTSSHELFRGPQVEFDRDNDVVRITQNVGILNWPLVSSMRNTVNNATLWGYPPRLIKLSKARAQQLYYGSCYKYFRRTLEFEINYLGWDRTLLDEGTKVLHGQWNPTNGQYELLDIDGAAPDPRNPQHFDKFADRLGNLTNVILNGNGLPSGVVVSGTEVEETLIAATPIVDQATLDAESQPTAAGKLLITVTDADGSVQDGIVLVTGTDTNGQILFENIYLTPGVGTFPYETSNTFKTLTNIYISSLQGEGGSDTVKVTTSRTYTQQIGYRYVQRYNESNFLLLGIPSTIGP